jgi:hypothetical protein
MKILYLIHILSVWHENLPMIMPGGAGLRRLDACGERGLHDRMRH